LHFVLLGGRHLILDQSGRLFTGQEEQQPGFAVLQIGDDAYLRFLLTYPGYAVTLNMTSRSVSSQEMISMTTQEQILSAAESIFARQGYDGTTMNQIADAAGLTKGAVYYFFRSKAELFCMIVDPGISYIEDQCRAMLDAPLSGQEIAQDVISLCINIAYDNASLFLILFGSRSAEPEVQELFDQRIDRLLTCIWGLVETGRQYNLLQPIHPEILTRMFVGIVYGMLALPDPPDRTDVTAAIRQMLISGIFAV